MCHITWKTETDNGVEESIHLPAVWRICEPCRGHGKHSHAIGAVTSSEWANWDPDERCDYLRGGYDRTCEACRGTGKVLEVDLVAVPDPLRTRYLTHLADERRHVRECESERRMERMMGC